MEKLQSGLGLLAILFVAWLLSENRWRTNVRLVVSGLALQFILALLLLKTAAGSLLFSLARDFVSQLIGFSDTGAEFVFGRGFREHAFAFSVLPTIIFVAAATSLLFHLGVLQRVVKAMARVMVWVMDTSGAESLAAAAEVFVGMTESPLVIRPYLETMTRSELMAMMTAGMGTVAGGVLAAYVSLGVDAGHLLTASLISAPGSLVIAKILVPETEPSPTKGVVRIVVPREAAGAIDAACRGAAEGLKLALNVAAMLIAFIALVAAVDWMLGISAYLGGPTLSLARILGWICFPLAWLLGIPAGEAHLVGGLVGKKLVLNELLAYGDLVQLRDTLSPRSFTIATYALCGFANIASVAVQIGGVGGLVPSRRETIARLGLRALVGGALATFLSATIAGILT